MSASDVRRTRITSGMWWSCICRGFNTYNEFSAGNQQLVIRKMFHENKTVISLNLQSHRIVRFMELAHA